jgi:4-hydroxy-4-methyl-2-oxoglutarate aldolase
MSLEELRQFDTCILADALETFDLRLRNQGYTRPGLRCMNGDFPPVLGYAVTARVRSSDPPVLGNSYVANDDWWPEIERAATPRIAVLQDVDAHPGAGACVGEIASAIFQALGCVGVVTNGAARNLRDATQIPIYASHVSPSHSYSHLVDHSRPVEICGLMIHHGDLLMADCHGVISIPLDLAPQLPQVAAELRHRKRDFVDFCRSDHFSLQRLKDEVKRLRP